ncbi:MAG: hypothetical protein IT249_04600 [Chitinophagaceae bacterium]|nr:hypothetical protein [Chitinophagaceae bacterium]
MEIYKIAIWAILFLGFGHSVFAFKKYKQVSAEALWFFSASLGLIFNGFLNYINLNVSNTLISNLTIGANAFQTIFFIVLALYIRKTTIFGALIISIILLVLSVIPKM